MQRQVPTIQSTETVEVLQVQFTDRIVDDLVVILFITGELSQLDCGSQCKLPLVLMSE